MRARPPRNLVIFARRPAYGVGKRRLAAEEGELAAVRFQRGALAALTRRLGADPRWRTWVAVTPDRGRRPIARLAHLPQGTGDLGARLRRVLSALPAGPVVVIGSDAPQVRRADVAHAFRALRGSDAVFGPSPDGGYWLVGLAPRRRPPIAFDNVRWSTPDALADTVASLGGASVALLAPLEDVDDAASLRRLAAAYRNPLSLFPASRFDQE